MRPLIVVEINERRDALPGVVDVLEAMLTVNDLRLESAVHTLCDGIVRGLVILGHRDAYTILLQFVRIGVTAVLYAPVRVMDESFQFIGRSLRDGHPESLERVFCLQCVGQAPAHDLTRISVSNQVQVTAPVHKVDVSYVAYPQLVGTRRHEAADEVLVLVVAVVRVRRVTWLRTLLHQLEVAQQLQKSVASGYPVAQEHALHHQPQFVVADARVHLADLLHCVHNAHYAEDILLVALAFLVIGLFASAKQFATVLDGIAE